MTGLREVDLSGQTALVTGGGQGIGEGIVRALAELGAFVVVNDLVAERADAVAATVNNLGGKAFAVAGDVSNPDAVDEMVRVCSDTLGPLDILVNNAAMF